MKYDSNFDIESILSTLRTISGQYPDGSPEDEAMRVAAISLLYIRESQNLDRYREFFRAFYTPAVDYIVVAKTFATREEAEVWITGSEPRDGDLIQIAGQGFQVIPQRDNQGFRLLRTPLPAELMKKPPRP